MHTHVAWPENPKDAPVFIEIGRSADEILAEGFLATFLKSREVQVLGVLMDGDDNPPGRYQRLRALCREFFPSMPKTIPADGLIISNEEGKRLGIWLMPDNVTPGNLEAFLRPLVPAEQTKLWGFAEDTILAARERGATWRDAHKGKAQLCTWLGWQDPPGRSPGMALIQRNLNPEAESARSFVAWFKKLYSL
jgi:hypothetical protein